MDEEKVLEFLTSLDAMELPDQIEEVNAAILEKIVEENEFVAVLFCEYQSFVFFSVSFLIKILNFKQEHVIRLPSKVTCR